MSKRKLEELEEFEEDMEEDPELSEAELRELFANFSFSEEDFLENMYPPEERELRKIIVSKQTIARLFGLSTRRIEQLTEQGFLEPTGRRPMKYALLWNVELYIRYLKYGEGA